MSAPTENSAPPTSTEAPPAQAQAPMDAPAAPPAAEHAPAPAPTGAPAAAPGGAAQTTGEQDSLDKGIDSVLKKVGHGQNKQTTEKISDGIRNIFKKVTGKDVPIKDKS